MVPSAGVRGQDGIWGKAVEPHPTTLGVGLPEDSRVGATEGRAPRRPLGLPAFSAGQFLRLPG